MDSYHKDKPSCNNWIGDIPEHWSLKKLKYLVSLIDEKTDSTDFLIGVENIEGKTGKLQVSESENTYQGAINKFRNGDTIFNKLRPYLAKVYFAEGDGGCIGELLILRSKGELFPKFLFYRMLSTSFIDVVDSSTYGTKMPRANWEDFIRHLFIPYPNIQEQVAIASYLDEKTKRIDILISVKQRLIELLKEEHSVIINQAVTKGLNPNVGLKPSGVNGFGDIPEHWQVRRLKYLANMQSGFAFSSRDFIPEGIQLIRIGNLYQNEFSLHRQPVFLPDSFLEKYQEWAVGDGDTLISMTGTLGKRDYGYAIQLKNTGQRFLLNQRVSRVRFIETEMNRELGLHILRSTYFQNRLFLLPTGTKQGNLSNEQVLSIPVVFSESLGEQEQIVRFINSEAEKVNSTISTIEKEIELMRHYRAALIVEGVTGKLKVV